jgi:hypothetical protein
MNFPPLGAPVVDSFRLFCMQEPRSLGAAVSFYCGRSHTGAAHTALADAQASLAVLVKQVQHAVAFAGCASLGRRVLLAAAAFC